MREGRCGAAAAPSALNIQGGGWVRVVLPCRAGCLPAATHIGSRGREAPQQRLLCSGWPHPLVAMVMGMAGMAPMDWNMTCAGPGRGGRAGGASHHRYIQRSTMNEQR